MKKIELFNVKSALKMLRQAPVAGKVFFGVAMFLLVFVIANEAIHIRDGVYGHVVISCGIIMCVCGYLLSMEADRRFVRKLDREFPKANKNSEK